MRTREHLTPDEVEQLLAAARRGGRYGQRDETLVLLAYRHGFRVSELVALRWEQVDFTSGLLHVRRAKRGTTHPVQADELRALRRLMREWPSSSYIFVSERGGPMTASNVRKLIARLGRDAGLAFAVHPASAAPCLRACASECRPRHPSHPALAAALITTALLSLPVPSYAAPVGATASGDLGKNPDVWCIPILDQYVCLKW